MFLRIPSDSSQTYEGPRSRSFNSPGGVTYFDVRMAPAAESVGSVSLRRRSRRRRWSL